MRRFVAPVLALSACVALGAPFVAAGCATSPSGGETHGPTFVFDANVPFTFEGGADDDAGDATTPIEPDDATTNEAATSDAPSALEAGDTGVNEADDGGDAGGPIADCGSPTVVLAGNGSSLIGAIATGTGAFTTQTITGSAALAPALVASSSGFQALVAANDDAGGGDALYGFGLAGTAWSSPTALGGSASTIGAPAVAAMGTTLQAVYLNPLNRYFHAQFNGTSWDTGGDEVLTADASVQSFGPVRASAAATATELVIAYEGNDSHLYVQSWTSAGGWQNGVEVGTIKVGTNIAPAIVALTSGASDFLVVYAVGSTATPPTNYINYALRNASSKTWSTPALTNINAYTPYEPSLAAMSGGRAIVGWRGGNNLPYTMELDPTAATLSDGGVGPAWTTPTPIASVNITLAPSLATGTCGYDAVAALATNGAVTVATYTNGAWVPPTPIAGISGASFAAIATSP